MTSLASPALPDSALTLASLGSLEQSALFGLASVHLLFHPLGVLSPYMLAPFFWNALPLDLHTKIILQTLLPGPHIMTLPSTLANQDLVLLLKSY